jgi:hypothetical protein
MNAELTYEAQKGIARFFVRDGGIDEFGHGSFTMRDHRGYFRLSADGHSVECRDEYGYDRYRRLCAIDDFARLQLIA